MNLELKIYKELGSINAAAMQWHNIAATVNKTMGGGEFKDNFNRMYSALIGLFRVVESDIGAVYQIQSIESFNEQFLTLKKDYSASFLKSASQPRQFTEAAHEEYITLSTLKEINTGYPLLKRCFSDLYQYMDKWVTNDSWLVMCADTVFKTTNRWLIDMESFFKQDPDEAWLIYECHCKHMRTLLSLLAKICQELEAQQ